MPRRSTNPKPKRTFADIAAAREKYNPETEGYGNPRQWRQTFSARMGFDEAVRIMSGIDEKPRQVLGVGLNSTWSEIKSAYRKLSMQFHPDRIETTGLDPKFAEEQFKRVTAAYTVLAREFGE
jgi:DnaJ-class molecular chaperone